MYASGMRAWIIASRFVGLSIVQQPTAAPGHPDWDGQADARRPHPWLAPGMWHPRIPLPSRMSRAARAASPVRDPPGAALTWVRRCLAVWEGRERPFQGASGRQPALKRVKSKASKVEQAPDICSAAVTSLANVMEAQGYLGNLTMSDLKQILQNAGTECHLQLIHSRDHELSEAAALDEAGSRRCCSTSPMYSRKRRGKIRS
eukprot:COSAG01_NODE_75_length_28415_cov_72.253267_15_plen_203_part_00